MAQSKWAVAHPTFCAQNTWISVSKRCFWSSSSALHSIPESTNPRYSTYFFFFFSSYNGLLLPFLWLCETSIPVPYANNSTPQLSPFHTSTPIAPLLHSLRFFPYIFLFFFSTSALQIRAFCFLLSLRSRWNWRWRSRFLPDLFGAPGFFYSLWFAQSFYFKALNFFFFNSFGVWGFGIIVLVWWIQLCWEGSYWEILWFFGDKEVRANQSQFPLGYAFHFSFNFNFPAWLLKSA